MNTTLFTFSGLFIKQKLNINDFKIEFKNNKKKGKLKYDLIRKLFLTKNT